MDRRAIQAALQLARRHGYAVGGFPDDPAPVDAPAPAPNPTVALAQQTIAAPRPRFQIRKSGTAPAPMPEEGGYEFKVFSRVAQIPIRCAKHLSAAFVGT